jgi:ornithine cyclodeaminase/alanine dehydrogenase-like protein (mu-crystallin family)
VFIVVCSETGAPLGIFSENRYLTDCRTGAAGGVAFKHCAAPGMDTVGFIGAGAIAKVMARAASCIRPFRGVVCVPRGRSDGAGGGRSAS